MISQQDINRIAMERMAELNMQLSEAGYNAHEREVLLVRLLLCLFADDTEVFAKDAFYEYVNSRDNAGSLGMERLNRLFDVLAGKADASDDLYAFHTLSNAVFMEEIPARSMDVFFWLILDNCRNIQWRSISPAIFGAMFQTIMDQKNRREWGAYYTSEENIMKVIEHLFLEQLRQEKAACHHNRKKLLDFQKRLSALTFLDPACGCGNFLIVIYRELRRLELEVLRELHDPSQLVLDFSMYGQVSLDQFYGMELESFQAQIARIGLWLTERQMNLEAAELFGSMIHSTPWIRPVKIRPCNALTTDWNTLIEPENLNYIVGNPPFLGARLMTESQKQDMKTVFWGFRAVGNLDYVTAWFRKSAEYMVGTDIRAAFVSTNSICQGEQAALLWKQMKYDYHMSIDFAWKTFVWNNEVKNQAKVHCIIVGFSDDDVFRRGEQLNSCVLYTKDGRTIVPHINAYLAAAPDVFVSSRRRSISPVPDMSFGSMANDGGALVLSSDERRELIRRYPEARRWIRPFLGSTEFINGQERYCLWLNEDDQEEYSKIPEITERTEKVRAFRMKSSRLDTRKLAEHPERFGEVRQPEEGTYILVPRVSSVRRPYIPMGFVTADWIASDAVLIIPHADESIFAVLSSSMHMIWVNTIAGRLKSDYRYSASVVYNNFPFPEMTEAVTDALAEKGQKILAVRNRYSGTSLASLYDPDQMPGDLKAAHAELDDLVDEIYGCRGFSEDRKLECLFERYRKLTGEDDT